MNEFATIEDVEQLFRKLTEMEQKRVNALLAVVSDTLRQEAKKVGKDLDKMLENAELSSNVIKSVTVDIIARTLMTSTNSEPMTQITQSALGYSTSGTFLVPGGGLFVKKSELARLGLRKQRYGAMNFYGTD